MAIEMQFLTDSNKKVRITIPNPVQPVDNTAVDNAMDLVVAKNVFAFPQGAIVKKVGATQVQTDSSTVG